MRYPDFLDPNQQANIEQAAMVSTLEMTSFIIVVIAIAVVAVTIVGIGLLIKSETNRWSQPAANPRQTRSTISPGVAGHYRRLTVVR